MADIPLTSKITSIEVTSKDPILRSTAEYSGIEFVRKMAAQRYAFNITWGSLTKAEMRQLSAQIRAMRGGLSTFTLYAPNECDPTGDGVALLAADTVAGTNSITVNVTSGTIKAGDKFTFGTTGKVYEFAEDSSGTGSQALNLVSPVRTVVSSGAALTFTNCKFTCRVTQDTFAVSLTPRQVYSVTLSAEEVLT